MKPEKRQNEILAILHAMQKELSVEELAQMLDVSPLTIRRDLKQLSGDKAIIRTHGGCLAGGRAALDNEYQKKVALNFELKQAIGKTAAKEVKPGEIILINDGSTTFHLSFYMGGLGPLTVYTNSLAMISKLSRYDDINLYILGGEYNSDLYSLNGSITEQMLEMFNFDLIFLGVDAIDDKGRCMVNTLAEARLTQIMLRSGRKKVLLADHTKVGAKSHFTYGTLRDFDIWITTPGMNNKKFIELKKYTHITESVL